MLKVFLVEDEFVVREGIKNNVDWMGNGFMFCGDASDGELAYPLIQVEKPDIIITDIRMPFMDGLELSRLIKRELPKSKIIILSGHEEFTYAQEALRIGVNEYLLKPINGAELLRVVKSVGEQVEHEQTAIEKSERHSCVVEKNGMEAGGKLLDNVVSGSLSAYKEYDDIASSKDLLELGSIDMKKVEIFLRNGEREEIVTFVDEFLSGILDTCDKSELFRKYFIINIYLAVLNFIKEIDMAEAMAKEPAMEPESIMRVVDEPKKARDYIIQVFTIAILKRDVIRTKRHHRLIEQVKEYINEHYADENISLKEVAAYANTSTNHFSTIFSREAGKSFIRYLTDLRMNKAKELLKCTDLLCSEISVAVGYKDPHYFSYLFKKAHNCSPVQYRAMKK
ncbi:MAG: response regulator [Clostridiaceae bacterium]|nr:response regulator [Clostridiaceae bacterium]